MRLFGYFVYFGGVVKNGGCVRRLESVKRSYDFLKGEKWVMWRDC